MKAFLRGLALLAAVTSVVWIAVIWRWQATRHDVGAQDLLTHLIMLPLVVFALLLALRWAVKGALAKEAASKAAQVSRATTAAGSTEAAAAAPDAAKGGSAVVAWPVLGAWVTSAASGDAAGMLVAAKEGKPRPAPDKSLRNQRGLPVTSARMSALDTADVRRAWERWAPEATRATASAAVALGVGGADGEDVHQTTPGHVWRALAALDELLPDALVKAEELVGSEHLDAGEAPQIRVMPVWPVGWTSVEIAGANHWLQRQLRTLLPGQDAAASGAAQRWTVQVSPPQSGTQAWLLADQLLMTLEQQRRDDVVVMLACHSDLGDEPVRALEARHRLYDTDTQPAGRMVGEGAAALLLGRAGRDRGDAAAGTTDAKLNGANWADEAVAWLHRPHGMRRETSIEDSGKVSSEVVRRLVRQAIDAARVEAANIGGLCCDGDQHSPRSTELLGTTIELLPELDVVEDVRLLGVTAGHAAQTGALWAVAGAVEQAWAAQRPALALSLADEHWRMATVVEPLAQPSVQSPG